MKPPIDASRKNSLGRATNNQSGLRPFTAAQPFMTRPAETENGDGIAVPRRRIRQVVEAENEPQTMYGGSGSNFTDLMAATRKL